MVVTETRGPLPVRRANDRFPSTVVIIITGFFSYAPAELHYRHVRNFFSYTGRVHRSVLMYLR